MLELHIYKRTLHMMSPNTNVCLARQTLKKMAKTFRSHQQLRIRKVVVVCQDPSDNEKIVKDTQKEDQAEGEVPSCLSGVRPQGQLPQQGGPDFPLLSNFIQFFWGDPEVYPGQQRDIVPPASPGSSRGPPTGRMCPENLTREESRRDPQYLI